MSTVAPAAGLEAKEAAVRRIIGELGSCIVAFSGGVDSALVLALANQELGDRAVGITARSGSLAEREHRDAEQVAATTGARFETIETNELEDPNYAANPADRCYYCKSELYDQLNRIAVERGIAWIVDGTNRDDDGDVRPGRLAARERRVRSPLHEAGFTKADVRALARKLDLSVWDKPAAACLSSRFPTGTSITLELLRQVERAEAAVLATGLRACRVRHHGEIARIEVPPEDIALAVEPERLKAIVEGVQAAGYRFVTLDLGGYRRPGTTGGLPKRG